MDRYTRKDAEAALDRLCAATGRRKANWHGDIGGLQLDYAACYGGFVVHEVVTSGGGVSTPLGDRRMPARQFCESINFALRA